MGGYIKRFIGRQGLLQALKEARPTSGNWRWVGGRIGREDTGDLIELLACLEPDGEVSVSTVHPIMNIKKVNWKLFNISWASRRTSYHLEPLPLDHPMIDEARWEPCNDE